MEARRPGAMPIVLAVIVAFVVGACSATGAGPTIPPSAAPSPTPLALDGHTYVSTGVTVNGAPKPLVAGTQIQIRFNGTTLNAQAGCNTMGGEYAISGGTLRVQALAMTEMGCDPNRHAQDDWLATFLAAGPALAATPSALTLEKDGTILTFVEGAIARPDSPLVSTTWRLDTVFQGDTASHWADVAAFVRFGDDGRLAIDTGCNTGSATYRLVGTDGPIAIGGIALTKRACQGSAGDVEALMVRVLNEATVAATISGPVLELRTTGLGLGFRDAASLTP